MTSLAGRNYARALFELAAEGGVSAQVEQEVRATCTALFDPPDVRAFLRNRLIGRTAKKRVVRGAFEGAVQQPLLVLLYLLVDRGRTMLLGEIAEEYERLSRLARGVRKVTLDTAFPLAQEEVTRVTRALESSLQARVELELRVQPALVGGVRAFSEGKVIELSVEGRLRDLRSRLVRGAPRGAAAPPASEDEARRPDGQR
ncbi:MAG TPA: ATP synthase F1 subunit delta [Spirochaetia bacterium]|nr:ATP synthase F1 subunit delta [Spirochaetia bacterium]